MVSVTFAVSSELHDVTDALRISKHESGHDHMRSGKPKLRLPGKHNLPGRLCLNSDFCIRSTRQQFKR